MKTGAQLLVVSIFSLCIANSISLFLVKPTAAFASGLTPVEAEASRNLEDKFRNESFELLKVTVNINSGTDNYEGIKKVGVIYESKLKAMGFRTSWVEVKIKDANGIEVPRGSHLIAERSGEANRPRVLLIGHLDTVFGTGSPFQRVDPAPRDPNKLSGPGIFDMKAGNLIIVESLQTLYDLKQLDTLNVVVAFMGDEERPASDLDGTYKTTRAALLELARRADVALSFEPGIDNPGFATIARRGSSEWLLSISARGGHSSQILTKKGGSGAIYPMAQILARIQKEMRTEKYLTVNVGNIFGGTEIAPELEGSKAVVAGKANAIPNKAQALGDIRFMDFTQLERARKKLKSIVDEELLVLNLEFAPDGDGPVLTAEVKFKDIYPPMEPKKGNYKLLQVFSEVSRDLGYGEVSSLDPGSRGAADMSFVAPIVPYCLDGLGAIGTGVHSENETMDVSSLGIAAKRAVVLLQRLNHPEIWKALQDGNR